MFELKYKITDGDIKSVNTKAALRYFVTYLTVALAGIAIGVTAIVLRNTTVLMVMGILLTVMGAFLSVCAVLLMLSPKNFAASALIPSDEVERSVRVDDGGITVTSDGQNSEIKFGFHEITKVKFVKGLIVAYIGREQILIFKDAVVSGGTLAELYAMLCAETSQKRGRASEQAVKVAEQAPQDGADAEAETAQSFESEKADGE